MYTYEHVYLQTSSPWTCACIDTFILYTRIPDTHALKHTNFEYYTHSFPQREIWFYPNLIYIYPSDITTHTHKLAVTAVIRLQNNLSFMFLFHHSFQKKYYDILFWNCEVLTIDSGSHTELDNIYKYTSCDSTGIYKCLTAPCLSFICGSTMAKQLSAHDVIHQIFFICGSTMAKQLSAHDVIHQIFDSENSGEDHFSLWKRMCVILKKVCVF